MYLMDTKINTKLHPLRDNLCNIVYSYLEESGNKVTLNKRKLTKQAVSCFILNTFFKMEKGINRVGITLDKNHYSRSCIINGVDTKRKVSYQYTRILFDALESKEYINLHKGGIEEYGVVGGRWQPISFESGYIKIHSSLFDLYSDYFHTVDKEKLRNVIIVRDDKGINVTFRMNPKTRLCRSILDSYNQLSYVNVVRDGNGKIRDVQLYKVFNGKSFEKGARNYMSIEGIQSLSKEERRELTINSNKTVIYDYKAFEPSIAYSMNQEIMGGDPYSINIEGYDKETCRRIAKVCMLILMNVSDRRSLKSAVNAAVKEEFNVDKLYSKGLIPEPRININLFISKLEEKHHLIRDVFCGGSSSQPSYIGSLISDFIIDYFTQRGILVLPVFDEFIIEEQHEEELKKVMVMAYDSVLGYTDNCTIVKEK